MMNLQSNYKVYTNSTFPLRPGSHSPTVSASAEHAASLLRKLQDGHKRKSKRSVALISPVNPIVCQTLSNHAPEIVNGDYISSQGSEEDDDNSMIFDLDPDRDPISKSSEPESGMNRDLAIEEHVSIPSTGQDVVTECACIPVISQSSSSRQEVSSGIMSSSRLTAKTFRTASSRPYSFQTAPSHPSKTKSDQKPYLFALRRLFERHGITPASQQKVTLHQKNYEPLAQDVPAYKSNETDESDSIWCGFNDENDWSGYGMHVDLKKDDSLELESLDEVVGQGATSTVDLVRCRGIKLARKTVLLRRTLTMHDVLQEVYALHKLRHAHIVRLVGTYARGKTFRILLYPVADLTLADLMGSLHLHHPSYNNILLGPGPWKEKLSDSSLCLISALRYIHSQGIKHMDIKPQNVLIQRAAKLSDLEAWRFELFLCDFGISHIFEADLQSQTSSYFGRTPKYAAPEVASDDRHGRAADIFSMGCVLAEMTTVFNGFALLEFEDYRRGAVVISTNDSYGLSSEPYNQTIDRSQQWVARLQSMAIDTEMIISMLDKLPSRRPKLCNVSGDIDIGINRKILQRVITLRCPHDADGPKPYKYDCATGTHSTPASSTAT